MTEPKPSEKTLGELACAALRSIDLAKRRMNEGKVDLLKYNLEVAEQMVGRIIDQLDAQRSQGGKEASLLEFIRTRCKVIFWTSPTAYPIEHDWKLQKDMWLELIDASRPARNPEYDQT